MTNEEIIENAQKQVKHKKEFFTHASIFVATSIFFFFLNYLTSPRHWWFFFPILGWGIALVGHYFNVFGLSHFSTTNEDWEEKQLRKEIEILKRKAKLKERLDALKTTDIPEKLELKELEKKWSDRDLV